MALTRVTNKYINSMSGSKLEGTFPESPKVDGALLTGISGVDTIARTNLALNYFKDSVNNSTDRMALEQGWIDQFEDESDVDNGTNTSLLNLVRFDGSNTRLQASDGQLNWSNSKQMTFSCWISFYDDTADEGNIFATDSAAPRLEFQRQQADNLTLILRDTSGNTVYQFKSNASQNHRWKEHGGLHHILFSIDAATSKRHVWIDDIEETLSVDTAIANAEIDYTDANFVIGASPTPDNWFEGHMGQFYLAQEYIDLSIEENRRKFISKDRQPVDLGQIGEKPTGSQPVIYLPNPASSFETNLGSGGDFTPHGSLSAVPSNSNVPMTKFDGTNDYLSTSPSNLGISNGKKFTMSFWYEPSVDSVDELFFAQNNNTFFIGRTTSGQLRVRYKSNTTTVIGDVFSPANKITVAGGKTHILIVIDTTQTNATDRVKISFNGGAIETLTDSTSPVLDGVIDITTDPTILIGSKIAGNDKIRGNLGQFYLAEDAVDISVQANRELFVSGTGANANPVDLGSDGSKPTGSSPIVYMNNTYGSFQTNLGSGGNFSVTGELVDGGYINNRIYDNSADSFSNSYEIIDSYGKENQNGTRSLGDSGRNAQKNAQCITLSSEEIITKVGIYTKGDSNPVNNCWVEIQGVTGTVGTNAVPNNNIIAKTNEVPASSVSTSFTLVYFTFEEPVVLAAGDYSIVFNCEEVSTGFMHGGHDNTPSHSGNQAESNSSGSWSMHSSWDNIYYLYGQKNLDLITKGSDDIGNSPSVAPEKGHMEVLLTERPAGGTTTWSDTLDSDTTSVNGYSLRQIILASDITNNANRIRVTLEGSSAGGTDLDNVAIVERSGNTSHGTTIPTEIFFGESSGVFIPEGGTVVSDWCDFKLRNDRDYLVVFDITNNLSGNSYRRVATGGNGHYFKPSSATYNTPALDDPTLLSTRTAIITKLEVENQQTLGTDIIAEMSRGVDGNGDKVWSPVTLTRTKTQVADMSYNILAGEADFTDGDPSGTNIVGRIRTGNKDKITVKGISVNWK